MIASISRLSVAESTGSVERVSAIKDMQSSWVQDARNEVKELRERVEMEKERQKKRRDSLNVEDAPEHYASSFDNNRNSQRIPLAVETIAPEVVHEVTKTKKVEIQPVGVSPAEIEFLRLEIEAARAKRHEFKAAAKRKQQEHRQQDQRQQFFEATFPSTVKDEAPRNNKVRRPFFSFLSSPIANQG